MRPTSIPDGDDEPPRPCDPQPVTRSAIGMVGVCSGCGSVHLTLQYMTLRLQPDAFRALVQMSAEAQLAFDDAARLPADARRNETGGDALH